MMWDGGMGLWMVLGIVLLLVFWVGVIGLVVWGIAAPARPYGPGTVGTEKVDALGIAKERYARGEMTKEEFEEKKRHLA